MHLRTPRSLLTGIIFLAYSLAISAQIAESDYYTRLYYTCKVWGHLKYFHTQLAEGKTDCDEILLSSLNSIRTAPDNAAFNDSLLVMIKKAGQMAIPFSNYVPEIPDSLNNNLDKGWMKDPVLSDAIKGELETIRQKFRPQNNIYLINSTSSAPSFERDNKYYTESDYPDENKRILSIFRYWNIIHYFYPYKHLMDQKWDETLREFLPLIVSSRDSLEYHLNFKIFTTRLNDSHAFFYSPTYNTWSGSAFPPFQIRFIQNESVITRILPSAPQLSVGDIIKKIDNIDIYKLRDSLKKYVNGSNSAVIERNLNDLITWGNAGDFSITVANSSGEKTIILKRNYSNYKDLIAENGPAWQRKSVNGGCDFGFVNMGLLKWDDVETMFRDLWDTDAIIFDVRNYPLGTLWKIVDFLYEDPLHIARFTVPDITYPGRLKWHEETIGKGTDKPYKGRLIILFDERTQSQAEYTCMGLDQFPGSVKIGSTTAAADGNVAILYLPGRIATYATFLGTYYPDYTPTQRVGIIPDIEIKPTIEGIRNARDEVLEAALNCRIEDEIMRLYPNPVKDLLHFNITGDISVKYEIYNILGSKLHSGSTSTGEIDVSHLASGLYIVRVGTKKHVFARKIIKY